MRAAALFSALAPLFLAVLGSAQTPAPPVAPTAAAQASSDLSRWQSESMVLERSETVYRMHADGTGEREIHQLLRVQSQGVAQQLGVLRFAYASANETPTIKLVRVHKADGSTVDTPATDAMEMPAEVTQQAPLYSDLKELHLPVRSLSVGDTLEYDIVVQIRKAEAPGEFWGAYHFTPPGTAIVLSEVLTLEVPADKYVQVWSPNHKPTMTEADGVRTYSWNVAQLVPPPKATGDDANKATPPKDVDEDDDGRKLPSVAWTTFHNWGEVGAWYRSLAETQLQPTDALRARAAEIVKDAKTPEDEVRALYTFVSTRTRYVGIDFGVGRYQPHAAGEVLANQYGDCKDKDTLLEALLRARGFSTAPALIGAGIAPVTEVPSPAVFNHVITTVNLPGGRIWLDSTPGVAPYRYLSAVIRDQKALVVPDTGAAELVATPATAPYPFTSHFEADATLDADGKLNGKMKATYRDDDEIAVRALAVAVAPAEWDKASQFISYRTGFGGTTSNTQFTNTSDYAVPVVMTYDYAKHPFGDWDSRRIVPLFPALEFTTLESETTAPQEDIQLGAPRTLVAISRIRLPEGFRTDVPDPVHVKTDFATFDKTYRFDGQELVAERTIVVLKKKVAKADWKAYEKFTKDIGLSGETWVQLTPPLPKPVGTAGKEPRLIPGFGAATADKGAVAAAPVAPGDEDLPADASVTELMQASRERVRLGDLGGAKEYLDKVKAKDPQAPNLWWAYGSIAAMQRKDDEAKADFTKELSGRPDNPGIVAALANIEARDGDTLGARKTIRDYLHGHPGNAPLSMYLATLENNDGDHSEALKTLQTAEGQHPDDLNVRMQIADTLVTLKRNDEAAAEAKVVLAGAADDPLTLNNAAYTLSETGADLSEAEEASRRSIASLEEKSATMAAAEANSRTFFNAVLLVDSWDTLGWVLYREGKTEEARPYLSAAWRASLDANIGNHLGQVDEALGHKNEAITDYAFARTALTANATPELRGHVTDSIARLTAAGAKIQGDTGTDGLQKLRTYKLGKATTTGWGSFRLEITTAGVVDEQQMSGDRTALAPVEAAIRGLKFAELLPPGSKAHLLRSGVVSCTKGSTCELVMVTDGGLQTEQ
ncbi:MAG TPA: DUF3857 domain-containing protein [Acidobacteriaceae bacterium]|jgi:tetratricopeptide (TPR) repeat protein/transglutaminase-like putative cysteine protease|nr:DUF3857 domain-containing protein [Acidobacteriaceae bacterium]